MAFDTSLILRRLAVREKVENFPYGLVREWVLHHCTNELDGAFRCNGVSVVIDRFGVKVPPLSKEGRKAYPKVEKQIQENLKKPTHFGYVVSIVDDPYIETAALVSADDIEDAVAQVMEAVHYVFEYAAEKERPAPVRGELIQEQLSFDF